LPWRRIRRIPPWIIFLRGEQLRKNSAGKVEADKSDKSEKETASLAAGRRSECREPLTSYRLALAADPDHFWSYFQLGRCYLALGKFSEAVEALGACVAFTAEVAVGLQCPRFALAQQQRYWKQSAT